MPAKPPAFLVGRRQVQDHTLTGPLPSSFRVRRFAVYFALKEEAPARGGLVLDEFGGAGKEAAKRCTRLTQC